MEKPKVSLSIKLLVDTKANKVLFAEANKDFVDFLFHIMSLPIGTITEILSLKNDIMTNMVGSIGRLYESIKSLGPDYIQPNVSKDILLKPKSNSLPPLLLQNDSASGSTPATTNAKKFYVCTGYSTSHYPVVHNYVSDAPGTLCPYCGGVMAYELTYISKQPSNNSTAAASSSGGTGSGYVKGVVTYMVMDNLEVKPMSTISALSLVSKFNVKDVSSLVEKQVQVGFNEGIAILKASLESQAVLTTVFLGYTDVTKVTYGGIRY